MNARDVLRPFTPASRAGAREHFPVPRFPRAVEPTQQLGLSERLFVALHRFTATNVTRMIELDGLIATRDLKAALRSVQARHPLLRAHISEGRSPHFVFDQSSPIPLHLLKRRDDTHWRELLESLLNTPVRHAGPLFSVHYLSCERSRRSELILVGEHAACDGVSMNSLAAELLELCARGMARAPRRRPPVLDQLLPPASTLEKARGFGTALGKFARVALHRAFHETRQFGTSSAHEFATLTREETAALMSRAKREDTTVTGALMAAVMQAMREVRPSTPRLALSVPVNLRPRLPGSRMAPEDLGNYTGAVYLETGARERTWPLARTLKRQLDDATRGGDLLAAVPLVYRMGGLLVRPDKPALAHAMLSNSGVVPLQRDYGAFRPLGFYSATSAPMVSADFCFFCNTLDGQLCLNVVFSTEVVRRGLAREVVARVRELLTQASEDQP